MAHLWEGYTPHWLAASYPSNSCEDSSSKEEELPEGGVDLGAGGPADDTDGVGLIQGDSHVPSVFALLAEGVVSARAGTATCWGVGEVAAGLSDPLIGMRLRSQCASLSGGGEGDVLAGVF